MKTKVAVVGMGNLGMAVAKRLENDENFELVAKFSKRNLEGVEHYDNIEKFKDKIDLVFVCGGSQNELEYQTRRLIRNFNIIESYDNHNRLRCHIREMDYVARSQGKIALCSLGWDPGIFSLMRGLIDSLGFEPYSFWGKGLSQGHTQAIKNIKGVRDAIQFTVPNREIIKQIKNGEDVKQSKNFHKRLCYVVADKNEQKEIKQQILTMKDYFQGYPTQVHFVSQDQLDQMKSFAHKGQVLTKKNIINFALNLPSNPEFTADVMTTFARAFEKLKQEEKTGAFSIFDLPMKYVLKDEQYKYL